ncbi:MAG: peptidoglycan DD-metalloendopeptidase family protein [Candidatus Alcyoniella australis]|nr:peptidoglycan DD-metalloendopeptidase family protein [Candidatus Alcyoniella australis]
MRASTALTLLAALALAVLCILAAAAQDEDGDSPQVQQAPPPEQREQLIEQERERVRSDAPGMRNLLAGLELIEEQERHAADELLRIDGAMAQVGHDIIFTEADSYLTRRAISREELQLSHRVRSLYILSRGGMAQVLLASRDFSNFVLGTRLVNRVVERDLRRLHRNREHVINLARVRQRLQQDRDYLERLKSRAESQRFWVDLERQRRLALIELISSDRALYSRAAGEREQAGFDLAATLERLSDAGTLQPISAPQGRAFASQLGKLPPPAVGSLLRTFGRQVHPQFGTVTFSNGVGIGAEFGAPVRAVYAGVVRYAGSFYGYGRVVILDHGDRFHSVYGHLDAITVSQGDKVLQSEVIGTVGRSGSLVGPQLHFEIRHKGKSIDPLQWLAWGSQEDQ